MIAIQVISVETDHASIMLKFVNLLSAPSSTQGSADRAGTNLPTYTLPTTYYYEAPSGYQVTGVGSSLVARPYTPSSPYTVQTSTTPTLRPGVTTHQVHGEPESLTCHSATAFFAST